MAAKFVAIEQNENPVEHRCEFCQKTFANKSSLNTHKKKHSGRRDYKCTLCTFAANTKHILTEHIRSHIKEKPYKCPHPNCPFAAATKSHLKTHQLIHKKGDEDLPRFHCSYSDCGFQTIWKSALRSHLKTHSGVKPFPCDICLFRSITRRGLQRHQLCVHGTERPFKCPQPNCDYSCKLRFTLARHIKTHLDEKSLACSHAGCTYKGKTKTLLNAHKKTHSCELSVKCAFCPFSCRRKESLTLHIRTHTGEAPYPCQICSYRATDSSNLNKHVRARHGKKKPFKCPHPNCNFTAALKSSLKAHQLVHNKDDES